MREARRMALLKRTGLFGENTTGADIERAVSLEDLLGAYNLVHDAYVCQGYIHPDSSGLRIRSFEVLPSTATFVAKVDGRVVGVQSLVVDSNNLGLPSEEAFGDVIDTLRTEGRLICEATNEAVDAVYRKTPITTELMRCCFAQAVLIGCDKLIAAMSPGHAKFYGMLGFEQIGQTRNYSKLIKDLTILMQLDFSAIADRAAVARKGDRKNNEIFKDYFLYDNPYHKHVQAWQKMSDRFFTDATSLTELFVHRSGLLERCSEVELDAICRQWGDELFRKVRT